VVGAIPADRVRRGISPTAADLRTRESCSGTVRAADLLPWPTKWNPPGSPPRRPTMPLAVLGCGHAVPSIGVQPEAGKGSPAFVADQAAGLFLEHAVPAVAVGIAEAQRVSRLGEAVLRHGGWGDGVAVRRRQWWPGGHGGSIRLVDVRLGRIQRVEVGRL
jgi:hypothetical protein